jgi:GWxTD domain-containing protein
MRHISISLITLCFTSFCSAQILRDINYSYQYEDAKEFSFELKTVRLTDSWAIFFNLELQDTSKSIDDYTIQWEKRNSLSDKETITLLPETINLSLTNTSKNARAGTINLSLSDKVQVIVARITKQSAKQAWLYHKMLEPNYPVNAYLKDNNNKVLTNSYIAKGNVVSIQGFPADASLIVSYYNDFFPTAAPSFSVGQAKVSKGIKADSTFTTTTGQPLTLKKIGLYLVQKDTTTAEGVSFRVEEEGYPKFRRVQDLVGPFIYICTKEEFDRLRMTGADKKRFDREVLNITRDEERAKIFMRNYFKRAEAANKLFPSYKEGWKTDRGMVYLIYGVPEKVFKFADREVWTYGKTNFNFIKSSTLFDPDNYVLIRDKKFTEQWYEKVDLVRNSRF